MLQHQIRKILDEAETAFQAMTAIETFATENDLPCPVKPADYVNTLFSLCLDLSEDMQLSADGEPEEPTDNKTKALFELNMELLGIKLP